MLDQDKLTEMRLNKEVIVHRARPDVWHEIMKGSYPPVEPVAFMEWWTEKIALIPAEYMSTGQIRIELDDDRDGVEIVISYVRPETDEEIRERRQSGQKGLDEAAEWRRKKYLELKEEFEPTQI